jgi:hypothetical protein
VFKGHLGMNIGLFTSIANKEMTIMPTLGRIFANMGISLRDKNQMTALVRPVATRMNPRRKMFRLVEYPAQSLLILG